VIPFFCHFSRQLDGTTYNVAPQFGSTIPSGLSITNSGSSVQVVMPNFTGGETFVSASVTYCAQAAASGTTLPVSVSASAVLGSTTGVAPAAGVIGEVISASASVVETTALSGGGALATATIATLSNLGVGTWLIVAEESAYWSAVPTTSGKTAGLGSDIYNGSTVLANGAFCYSFSSGFTSSNASIYTKLTHSIPITLAATTPITFRLRCDKVSGDEAHGSKVKSTGQGFLKAIRIA
jgi:hypothetical protein